MTVYLQVKVKIYNIKIIIYYIYIYMADTQNRLNDERASTNKKSIDDVLTALYSIISKYNGVIRQVIAETEPKGKWSTSRSVQSSTANYLASVVKSLIEPLKHLVFQMSGVHNDELGSMLSLFRNMVVIIDSSPPFKLIDIEPYKKGFLNTEGLSNITELFDIKAYGILLADLFDKLKYYLKDEDTLFKTTLESVKGDKRLSELTTVKISAVFDEAEKIMKELKEEIKKTKLKVAAGSKSLKSDEDLINRAQDCITKLKDNLFVPTPVYRELDRDEPPPTETEGDFAEGNEAANAAAEEELGEDEEEESEEGTVGTAGGIYTHLETITNEILPKSKKDINKEHEISSKQLKALQARKKVYEKLYKKEGVPYDPESGLTVTAIPDEDDKKDYASIISKISRLEDKLNPKKDKSKTGGSFPLADLLANPKQQYNSMGRPLSDNDKINNDMINANKNWQIKNNEPHSTEIGSLNPFLTKDTDIKYTYQDTLRKKNSVLHPTQNALGADVSLLQGPTTGPIGMEGEGGKKKSKAVNELMKTAIDSKNDMFKPVPLGENGMIPEDKDDQFKLPDLKKKDKKRR